MSRAVVVLMAKRPDPGRVKTRLIPTLGAEKSAALAKCLLHNTTHMLKSCENLHLHACLEPEPAQWAWEDEGYAAYDSASAQMGADLGARMATVCEAQLSQVQPVLLVGADCPALHREHIQQVLLRLASYPVCIVPAHDGGYVLLGLQRWIPQLFTGIDWGSNRVLAQTLAILARDRIAVAVEPPLQDIDRPEDIDALPANLLSELGLDTPILNAIRSTSCKKP